MKKDNLTPKFSPDVIQKMDITENEKKQKSQKKLDPCCKYYVYGLLDPTTYQPFYIGKGCENRVFDHEYDAYSHQHDKDDSMQENVATQAQNAVSPQSVEIDEEMRYEEAIAKEESAKIEKIIKIMRDQDKKVIYVIYRWGLTEAEAFAVEATLIDVFPGLTNIQSGHEKEFGMIPLEDLRKKLSVKEYDDPEDVDYIIIKTTPKYIRERSVNAKDDLYEATRKYWVAQLNRAQDYRYVISAVQGIVRAVYKVPENGWIKSTDEGKEDRIEFTGTPITKESIENKNNKEQDKDQKMYALIGKRLPAKYTKKGLASPFLYKKK